MTAAVWLRWMAGYAVGPATRNRENVAPHLEGAPSAPINKGVEWTKSTRDLTSSSSSWVPRPRAMRTTAPWVLVVLVVVVGLVRGGVADEECRRRPRASGGMSVFGDFQRVWVQRFPDSALPAAWEEDVRANLVKHKQKVSWYSCDNLSPEKRSRDIFHLY